VCEAEEVEGLRSALASLASSFFGKTAEAQHPSLVRVKLKSEMLEASL
jgi:hypothetical protein